MNETAKGSRVILPSGKEFEITESVTTATRYLRQAALNDELREVPKEDGGTDLRQGEARFFTKADGTGRIYVGAHVAAHTVIEELK